MLPTKHGTGRTSQPSPAVALEDPTILKTTSGSGLFDRPNTLYTQHNEPPQEEPQEVVTKPSKELHDSQITEVYPHLNRHHDPPPSQFLQKKRKGFLRHFMPRFRELFRFGH